MKMKSRTCSICGKILASPQSLWNHTQRHRLNDSKNISRYSSINPAKSDVPITFPDNTQAGESDFADVKKWLEVPLATWYKVESISMVRSKFGPSYNVSLVDRSGATQRYWTTKMIGEEVDRRLRENNTSKNVFVKSLGSRLNSKGTNTYYNYDILLF